MESLIRLLWHPLVLIIGQQMIRQTSDHWSITNMHHRCRVNKCMKKNKRITHAINIICSIQNTCSAMERVNGP